MMQTLVLCMGGTHTICKKNQDNYSMLLFHLASFSYRMRVCGLLLLQLSPMLRGDISSTCLIVMIPSFFGHLPDIGLLALSWQVVQLQGQKLEARLIEIAHREASFSINLAISSLKLAIIYITLCGMYSQIAWRFLYFYHCFLQSSRSKHPW